MWCVTTTAHFSCTAAVFMKIKKKSYVTKKKLQWLAVLMEQGCSPVKQVKMVIRTWLSGMKGNYQVGIFWF